MSQSISNGLSVDIPVQATHSLKLAWLGGTYTAQIISGAANVPVGLATNSASDKTFGPYATAIMVRLTVSAIGRVAWDTASAPAFIPPGEQFTRQDDGIPVTLSGVGPAAAFEVDGAGNSVSQTNGLDTIKLAATRRVDLVMLGDSNQTFSGYGFQQGIDKRLQTLYGAYATPLVTAGGGGAGGGFGYLVSSRPNTDMGRNAGADVDLAAIMNPGIGKVNFAYGYLAPAASTGTTGGINLAPGHSIGAELALNVYLAWGGAPEYSGGTFRPRARASNAAEMAYSAAITTTLSQRTMRMTTLSVTASAGRVGLGVEAGWSAPNGVAAVGPLTTYYSRIEAPSRITGTSCHTLYGVGGDSAWDMAYSLRKAPTESLTTFFAETRRLQIAKQWTPKVVVYINSGLNDRNEVDTPSMGPARSTAPDSADAYVDNLTAIMARIYEVWSVNGWDRSELSWIVVPSHRIGDPDDAKLLAYRAAAKTSFSGRSDVSVVDLGEVMTFAQATADGWYGAGQNQLHLTNAGYDGVSALIFPTA